MEEDDSNRQHEQTSTDLHQADHANPADKPFFVEFKYVKWKICHVIKNDNVFRKNGNATFKRARPPDETEVWKTSTWAI